MAIRGIDTVITEFETVKSLFNGSVNDFVFGEISEINTNNLDYPCLFLDRGTTTSETIQAYNNGMPRKKRYELDIILFDTYEEGEQSTTDLSAKFEEMELVLHQYLSKVYRRGESNVSNLILDPESIVQDYAQTQHGDQLVSVGTTVTLILDITGCDTGDVIDEPSNLTATINGVDIDLAWTDNSDNEVGFRVYKASAPTGPFTLLAEVATTTHTDLAPTQDAAHFYHVTSYNATAESLPSTLAWATVSSGGVEPLDITLNNDLMVSDAATDQVINVHDTNGDDVGSKVANDFIIPNSSVRVEYENGTLIEEVSVKAGGSTTSQVPNAITVDVTLNTDLMVDNATTNQTINVHDSGGADVGSKSGSDYVIGDSTVTVEYVNGTLIETVSVNAEGVATSQVPNPNEVDITLNSALMVSSATTNQTINVHNTAGADVGSKIGSDFIIPDSTVRVEYLNGTLIENVSVAADGSATSQVANPIDVDVTLNSDLIVTGATTDQIINVHNTAGADVGSNVGGTYVIPDSTVTVQYVNGTLIESVTVAADGSAISQVPNPNEVDITLNATLMVSGATTNQTISVHDSAGADVGSQSGSDFVVADGSVRVEYVNGTLIENVAVTAEGSATSQVPNPIDVDVTLNSDLIISAATTDQVINVHDTAGADVGSIVGSDYVIGDATAVLKDTAGTTLSSTSIVAQASQDITAPDGSAVVKYQNGDPISTTAIKSNETKEILVPDVIAKTTQLVFQYKAGYDDFPDETDVGSNAAGSYTTFTLTNMSALVFKVNGTTQTYTGTTFDSAVAIANGDTLSVEGTITDDTQVAKVLFDGTYT